jgi:hypothetical protein
VDAMLKRVNVAIIIIISALGAVEKIEEEH